MGRPPCCDENGLKKGPWTPEEDQKLIQHIKKHGHGSWRALPKLAGLNRCGKSCRLRWTNYLRPDIKRGKFSPEEEETILNLHSILGNKWSAIASHLSGRTDNEIKNFWNTHLKKKLVQMGCDPMTHRPSTGALPQLVALADLAELIDGRPWDGRAAGLQAVQAAKLRYLLQQSADAMANSCSSNGRGTMAAADLEAMSLLSSQMVSSFPAIPRPDRVIQHYSSFLREPPTNQECYAMAGPALFASPRSPLPPNNDASVINQGDGCSISSYSGNGSDSIWPELLLDDQFMAGFD